MRLQEFLYLNISDEATEILRGILVGSLKEELFTV